MKVGTDGVVLGAWANLPSNGLVLDVGTGTGLIALMVAQRTACKVVGIEIDEVASVEAKENADSSPFRDRVEIIHTDFVDYEEPEPMTDEEIDKMAKASEWAQADNGYFRGG